MFAQFIKTSGQTRAKWAHQLGISASYLSDLLNKNRIPSLDLAVRIERETDGAVPASSWVAIAPPKHAPPPASEEAA